jgi:hypothetical protein
LQAVFLRSHLKIVWGKITSTQLRLREVLQPPQVAKCSRPPRGADPEPLTIPDAISASVSQGGPQSPHASGEPPPTVIEAPLGVTTPGHSLPIFPIRAGGVSVAPRLTRPRGGGEPWTAHAQKVPFANTPSLPSLPPSQFTWESRNSTTTFSLLHRAAISLAWLPRA